MKKSITRSLIIFKETTKITTNDFFLGFSKTIKLLVILLIMKLYARNNIFNLRWRILWKWLTAIIIFYYYYFRNISNSLYQQYQPKFISYSLLIYQLNLPSQYQPLLSWNIHFYIKVFNNMIKPLLHCRETFQFDRW